MITVSPLVSVFRQGFPMAEPEFFANGWILYNCPLGCQWRFWMKTPLVAGLNNYVETSRKTMSDHYRNSHGVIDD